MNYGTSICRLALFIGLMLSQYVPSFGQCPDEFIDLNSQQEVDSFRIKYPDCHDFKNAIWVRGQDIVNLEGLSELKSVLSFHFLNNDQLTSLEGLERLTSVGALFIRDNPELKSLKGLENLFSVNKLYLDNQKNINSLDALTSISQLYNLTIITSLPSFDISAVQNCHGIGEVYLDGNVKLVGLSNQTYMTLLRILRNKFVPDLNYLRDHMNFNIADIQLSYMEKFSCEGILRYNSHFSLSLERIDDLALWHIKQYKNPLDLHLIGCNSIRSLSDLKNIELRALTLADMDYAYDLNELENLSKLRYLVLDFNSQLNDISAIAQVDTLHEVWITTNLKLRLCDYDPICKKLQGDEADIVIWGNGNGCNTRPTVLNQCTTTSIQEIENEVSIFPNPSTNSLTLESNHPFFDYSIFSMAGEKMYSDSLFSNQVDISTLVPGSYILRLVSKNQFVSTLFIKE